MGKALTAAQALGRTLSPHSMKRVNYEVEIQNRKSMNLEMDRPDFGEWKTSREGLSRRTKKRLRGWRGPSAA